MMFGTRFLALVILCTASSAAAQTFQTPLFLVDDATNVHDIAFRFEDTRTFETGDLKEQIATTEPGFIDRVKRVLPLVDAPPHRFSPLELQRDVARLRRFYRQNGFPDAQIDYGESRLDERRNRIRIIFSIFEGEPVLVRSIRFVSSQGDPFPDPEESGWETFTDAVDIEVGDRYSEIRRQETRNEAYIWLRDHGYAFANVNDTVAVDTTARTAELTFTVDPGPLVHFGEIAVEGNESVSDNVILRELPFEEGQRFSESRLRRGQREVFGLNLFRTVLVDLPSQREDSSARVVVRVREGRPQLLTYRVGFGRETGTNLEGTYTHRNFFGGARTLTGSVITNTGVGGVPAGDRLPERLLRLSAAVRQPYLFTTRLSGTVAPYYQMQRDPQIGFSQRRLGVNAEEYGLTTSLLYEVLPFRTITLQHTFGRVAQISEYGTFPAPVDRFNRSVLTLSGVIGRSDDYVNPTRGVLLRPNLEMAGRVLGSGVQYFKAAAEATAYTPLSRRTGLAVRLAGGRLWPVGISRDQDDPVTENRFDPIRFYAGGGNDVRGWGDRLVGPKIARPTVIRDDTLGFAYEPVGGLSKLGASVELRLPFPGLGPEWGTAVFLDAGSLGDQLFSTADLRLGTGAGIRYRTPVGFVRLDLAYKLNPDARDLRSARDFYRHGEAAPARGLRRLKLHLTIGQAF